MTKINMTSVAQWEATGSYLDFEGYRIFRMSRPNPGKPVLLLLHGFPTFSADWLPVWDTIGSEFELLTFDFLGFGFSDKPRNIRYSIHQQADIAEAVLARHGADKVHILTHDYGVSVAQELLARHREGSAKAEYLSCCFLNGGLLPAQHRPRPIQKLLAGPLGFLFARLMNRQRFEDTFCPVFGPDTQPDKAELNAYWYGMSQNRGHLLSHKLIRYMADRREHAERWRAVLARPSQSLMLVNGNLDPISGKHLADEIAQLNPDITIHNLPDIGHYPQVEASQRVSDAFLEWHRDLR